MSKHISDIRGTSADTRYMGIGFVGLMDNAINQARNAPTFSLPDQPHKPAGMSRDRYNLLQFLNLLDTKTTQAYKAAA